MANNENFFVEGLLGNLRGGINKIKNLVTGASNWFAAKIKSLTTPQKIIKNAPKTKPVIEPGRMFMFWYDPKHKQTLPYYDEFPLIFFVGKAPKGFYGINLHYVDPKRRAALMDALYSKLNNKNFDATTRALISYRILKGVSKLRYYKPCFKHYLIKHVRTRMVEIPASEWDKAIMLPTERFKKASKQQVWKESAAAIGK